MLTPFGQYSYPSLQMCHRMADTLISLSASAYYEGQKFDWAGDTINVIGSDARPFWKGQKSSSTDVINGLVNDMDMTISFIEDMITRLFFEQSIGKQLTSDMYNYTIPYKIDRDVSLGYTCDPHDTFIPSHTKSVYLLKVMNEAIIEPQMFLKGLSPSPTITLQPSGTLGIAVWYPMFEDSLCRNDGLQSPHMENSPEHYLFATAELCCARHFQWAVSNVAIPIHSFIILSS